MSIEGLREFNGGFGFPLVKGHQSTKYFGNSRSKEIIGKLFASIPFAIIFAIIGGAKAKEDPAAFARGFMCTTIVLIPIVVILDLIGTALLIPLCNRLEKKRVRRMSI